MFEKVLVQRAKAFRTIVNMNTVMKKNVPHHVKIDKVQGRTFHLPLPLEETLKKNCPKTDALNIAHEIFIMVRSNPTKNKVIWRNYVDVEKVWNVLHWLKKTNPLYSNITIPSEKLLDSIQKLELEFEDCCQTELGKKPHIVNKHACKNHH